MQSNRILDYSQWKNYKFCELSWFEKYRLETRKERKGQQSDAITLGSLVHDGLRNYRLTNSCVVPAESVGKFDPTPECLAWAQELLLGYVRTYPNEQFTRYYCEEPLRFPLVEHTDGLAVLDSYFHIAEPVTIASGLGDTFTLEPGNWIYEYKTKAASKDIGKYLGSWRMNMQACFQMLALEEKLGEPVKGLFVNVLEKPKEYQPKHTCKECKVINERRNWEPTGVGYKCPDCGNVQELNTSDKSKTRRVPAYYRFMVTRTRSELALAKQEIAQIAEDIDAIDNGKRLPGRSTESCMDQVWGECDYFQPHSAGLAAGQYAGFVKVEALGYITK